MNGAGPEADETPVPSPCTNICKMNETTGWCDGCLRSIDEIVAWGGLDDAAKRAVWLQLAQRRRHIEQARAER